MTEGLRAKAARGELRLMLPAGLDYDEDDHVIITPDEAVREAVTCVLMTLAESPQSCSAEFPTLLGHQTT